MTENYYVQFGPEAVDYATDYISTVAQAIKAGDFKDRTVDELNQGIAMLTEANSYLKANGNGYSPLPFLRSYSDLLEHRDNRVIRDNKMESLRQEAALRRQGLTKPKRTIVTKSPLEIMVDIAAFLAGDHSRKLKGEVYSLQNVSKDVYGLKPKEPRDEVYSLSALEIVQTRLETAFSRLDSDSGLRILPVYLRLSDKIEEAIAKARDANKPAPQVEDEKIVVPLTEQNRGETPVELLLKGLLDDYSFNPAKDQDIPVDWEEYNS